MTSPFVILPAIDLRGGRVVRLERGDFGRETAFSDDPVAVARAFAAAGAEWLHVVDLDGARTGSSVHRDVIDAIIAAVGRDLAVEVAGGLRTVDRVDQALAAGARRAVVGTAALRDPGFAAALVERHGPDRLAVALDVRDGLAVGDGWASGAEGIPVADVLRSLAEAGVRTFEVTAIERDGTGGGPDLELYRRLIGIGIGRIIASAGITTTDDVLAVRTIGCSGAIIGRALYDGRLTLPDALDAATTDGPIHIRRPMDGELLGTITRTDGEWEARTVFGGVLARTTSAAAARGAVESDGLDSLARRWFLRRRTTGTWQVVVIVEAWPGRARVAEGAYALPGVPTSMVTAEDLAAGDLLTLEPPPGVDVEELLT